MPDSLKETMNTWPRSGQQQPIEQAPNRDDVCGLLSKARTASRLGALRQADNALSEILDQDPKHQEALTARGAVRNLQGRFAEAKQDYLAVTSAVPIDTYEPVHGAGNFVLARAFTGLADLQTRSMAKDSLKSAEASLACASRFNGGVPLAPWGDLVKARIALESGNEPDARNLASRLVEQHPNDPRALLTLAEIYDVQGHYCSSVQAAKRALDSDVEDAIAPVTSILSILRPKDVETDEVDEPQLLSRLRYLQASNSAADFLLIFKTLLNAGLNESEKSRLFRAADWLTQSTDKLLQNKLIPYAAVANDDATQAAQSQHAHRILTKDPATLYAQVIAALRTRSEHWQKTCEDILRSVSQVHGSESYFALLIQAALAEKNPGLAVACLSRAADKTPDDRPTQLLLLQAEHLLGAPNADRLARLTASRPDGQLQICILEIRAGLASQRGDYAEAIEVLDEICQKVQEARFYALRASYKLAGGRSDKEVLADCALALSYDELNYLGMYTRGQQCVLSSKLSAAKDAMESCRKNHEQEPDPLYFLGEIALARGLYAAAIEYYRQYLDGSFAQGRQYRDEARLGIARAHLQLRDYESAVQQLIQVDGTNALYGEGQKLYAEVVARKEQESLGILWWECDLNEIEALITAEKLDSALATLNLHQPAHSRNVRLYALYALIYYKMTNYALAESIAQVGAKIAALKCHSDPLLDRILREARAKNSSLLRSIYEFLLAIARYFESY